MGIDPGTFKMGLGVVESDGEQLGLVHCGVLSAGRSSPLAVRLHQLYTQLVEQVEQWQPSTLAIEAPFVARNPRSAMAVGQAQAVALMAAARYNLQVATYSPRQVKQAITDYGGSSKEQVQQMVRVHLGLAHLPGPLDATDALAVALCHLQHMHEKRLVDHTVG